MGIVHQCTRHFAREEISRALYVPRHRGGGDQHSSLLTAAVSDRFTDGWTKTDDSTIKGRIVDLLKSIRSLLRIPLIFVNLAVILYELTLG